LSVSGPSAIEYRSYRGKTRRRILERQLHILLVSDQRNHAISIMLALIFRLPLQRCHRPARFLAAPYPPSLPFRKQFGSARMEPVVAEGSNQEPLLAQTRALIDQESWALDEDRMGVIKTYYFKTYTKCLVSARSIASRNNYH
jgi:hypothetical protein